MNPTERKLLKQSALIGTALTLLVVAADRGGLLDSLERWLYDRRARICQFFTPPPTDKLVHMDIDDPTLEAMGHWPWPRSRLGKILDELNLAGAKAVAMDIIFPEPQEVDYRPEPGEVAPVSKSGEVTGRFHVVHDDRIFAESIRRGGRTLVPFSVDPAQPRTPRGEAMVEALTKNLELDQKDLDQRMTSKGLALTAGKKEDEQNRFLIARQAAMFDSVLTQLQRRDQTVDELRQLLLPKSNPAYVDSPLIRLLRGEYDRAESLLSLRRYSRPKPEGLPLMLPSEIALAPTPILAQSAGASGFVYYDPDEDGVIRAIPLWADHRGYVFPQLALSLACTMLDVKPGDVRLEADRMVIPRPGGNDIVIPVRTRYVKKLNADVGFFFDIPWFGTRDWEVMYDPHHREPRQHYPLLRVWDIHELLNRVITNNRTADKTIRYVLGKFKFEGKTLEDFNAHPLPLDDPSARIPWIDWCYGQLKDNGYFDVFKGETEQHLEEVLIAAEEKLVEAKKAAAKSPGDQSLAAKVSALVDAGERAHDDEELFSTIEAMRFLPDQTRSLKADLDRERASLRRDVQGRAVIIGWTATAAAADFVPTSLQGKCPGPVVHGVIFNAIMTGEFWWQAAPWVAILITLLIGLLTTAVVAFLPPLRGAISAALLGGGYLVVNGIVLFDYGNWIVGAAGPLTSVAVAWSGVTVWKFIAEIAERRRITRRFSNYASPKLVNWVLAHPDQVNIDGEIREMSVVFTDLAGFTTLSERLKEKTVGILNEYLALMVPVIENDNDGLVNKFLGDGIMFFCGAPEHTPDHALQATTTVLQMQNTMKAFNRGLEERGFPTLVMRAGIGTGPMIVGDAGSDERHDYTVLGDNVNLASRLESANKYTGTRILINDRAAALVGEMYLLRPVGRLVVVGKAEGVMTYEPLCPLVDATPEQKRLVETTNAMVEAFQRADFNGCLKAIVSLESIHGSSGLTKLYTDLCRKHLEHNPGDDFQGFIVLTEK